MKLFLKCDEAAHVCDKSQYKESSFLEKLNLKIHILLCPVCRAHVKRNCTLTQNLHRSNLKTLRPEEKELLKKRMEDEINIGHNP